MKPEAEPAESGLAELAGIAENHVTSTQGFFAGKLEGCGKFKDDSLSFQGLHANELTVVMMPLPQPPSGPKTGLQRTKPPSSSFSSVYPEYQSLSFIITLLSSCLLARSCLGFVGFVVVVVGWDFLECQMR